VSKGLLARPFPVLGFLGMGRAGKDTACEWFRDHTPLRFVGSSSWSCKEYVAMRLDLPVQEAWETRHQRRLEWKQLMDEYREQRGHSACVCKMLEDGNDLICGLRNRTEIVAARAEGLVDLFLWVDNPRVPVDPTVDFTIEDCDLVIRNAGAYAEYYARLARLAATLKIPVS
jgi:hypothetical protein